MGRGGTIGRSVARPCRWNEAKDDKGDSGEKMQKSGSILRESKLELGNVKQVVWTQVTRVNRGQ